MELRLQPKPEVKILPADKGIVSRKQFFIKKEFEKINQNSFPAHFIRNWKPKAELIYPPAADETVIQYECDFNRNIQNCFVEDYAEEVYLKTPPPCFVIIGKYGKSVIELSKKIATEFGSVLIRVDDVVNEVLKEQTETSHLVHRILRLGVSLTLNFILALLSYVAHTAEARHRGYVLCGLPSPPVLHDLSPDQQFNYLFTWENKPTVFIHILFDDEDLIKERTNSFLEFGKINNTKYIKLHFVEESAEDEDEDETEVDEMLPIREETFYERDIDISPSRPWVQLPRNEESRVWTELELFDNIIRPSIELINVRVDPQYLVTVDSRIKNEFKLVLARLSLLQIWRAPMAEPFIRLKEDETSIKNETDENEEQEENITTEFEDDFNVRDIIKQPPQIAFLTLFNVKTISPKFRWELSHYNYICPVSLREGEVVEGKSEFAVAFMKYIYFLRDKKSVVKFIQNPRAYVLPIRPKPLCRFIVLGYPFSGKTTLAEALASEFSIPLIDVNMILKNDSERKKNIYQEFCRQKAECREIIRLTSLTWQDWRMEEERRINLIEGWILYIQNLLRQRIEQFYTAEVDNDSVKETQVRVFSSDENTENTRAEPNDSKPDENPAANGPLVLQGMPIDVGTSNPRTSERFLNAHLTSPSAKIIHAMKHEDFDFNEKHLEVEANLFFSSLWKSFSCQDQNYIFEEELLMEETYENFIDFGGESQFTLEEKKSQESVPVDWCSLLPPQSLSTLLINKSPNSTREKRQSFKIFLEAASKAYWAPSTLKSEFAKWRLPCFLDIPLCEIFLNNPILLLKYVPEWLKERPLIPDPIDPMHPSVLEAGRQAYFRASVVVVKQNQEEIGILLRDAIEKAEREGMRVTGEVISPGGWVVDNMTLDLNVWNKLACENVFADHLYILIDTEPDYRRIINLWWNFYGQFSVSNQDVLNDQEILGEGEEGEVEGKKEKEDESKINIKSLNDVLKPEKRGTIIQLLIDSAEANTKGEEEIDEIYKALKNDAAELKPPFIQNVFCREFLRNTVEALPNVNDDFLQEEALLSVQTLTSTLSLISHQNDYNIPLGVQLELFTEAVLNYFRKKAVEDENEIGCDESLINGLEFFLSLLTLPAKLEQLKDWMTSIGRGATIHEIEMTGKSCDEIFSKIQKDLMAPFIKKPRELESFEIEEIKNFNVERSSEIQVNEEELENEDVELEPNDEEEDLRIFGESGPLCIVNLERDIFLRGNPEFALRYYGKLYYFWNQEAKDKFIENPQKYAPYYSAIRCYPPLRVFIVGPVGCGKTKIAESLANQFSISVVDYSKFVTKNLIPHVSATCRKFAAITDQKLLVSEEHNAPAKIAKQNFVNAPYEKRQFWLESPFYLDFLGSKKFLNKMINITQPMIIKNFPELKYSTIKILSKEKLYEEEPNLTINLPETPYVSMEEIETIIANYLQNNSDLSDYCIDKSFKILWTEEPYITQGFALEGFPLRFSDITHIIENNWIPDLVIEISLPEDDIIERNTDVLMEFWDTKLKQEIVEERVIEDTLISIQNLYISMRRNELTKEKRNEAKQALDFEGEVKTDTFENENLLEQGRKIDTDNNLKSKEYLLTKKPSIKRYEIRETAFSEKSFGLSEEVEQKIQKDVEKTLKDEFPSLVFNSVFETYDAGKSRITGNLLQMYKRDADEIDKIRAALKEQDVPWLEIDGLKNQKQILTDLFRRLDKIKKRSTVRGEFSFTMSMEMAETLLFQGFYFLSKFGRWCPVQMYQKKNPIHMFRPFAAKRKITPIAYRNYIYFVAGENEKIKFMNDPIKYTFNEPHFPNIPIRIAIIGPPKSGKSILSQRLGAMFDLKVVTMGTALRFVLEKAPQSTLAKSINSYLRRGCFLPLSLKVEALMVCLNDPSCVTQGFIFDGIPFDAALTQSLAEKRKLPFVIISLVADSCFGKSNRQGLDLKEFRLPYKNRSNLNSRYRDWNNTYKKFAQWNQNSYNNLYEVNAELNVVDIFYRAYDIIRNSTLGIFYYVEYCVSDRVLPLHYLCVSQHEYELRKSPFHNNCPVCWSKLGRLSSCSDPPPRSGLVQYLNLFYWICPKHMESFINNPKVYFPPHASKCPEFLPKSLDRSALKKSLVHLKIHGFGRCPVTRIDFPSSLDWEGSHDFAARYMNEVFLFRNEEMLDRFLSQPWRYYQADTKFEVHSKTKSNAVEQLGPPKMTSLPPIGFLEQTVADLIHECLQVLGVVRPVYPNMSPTITGCIFVALYLKVYNKKNQNSHLDRQYLNIMFKNCKAHIFLISPLKSLEDRFEIDLEDSESDQKVESDSSSEKSLSSQRSSYDADKSKSLELSWMNLEFQVERNIWSARNLGNKFTEMKLTSDNELIEIPDIPKLYAILKYQKYSLRTSPIPPISNCLTFLYSNKKDVQIPEKFSCNTLYQPLPLIPSPVTPALSFNPDKQFSMTLHSESKPSFPSKLNLRKFQDRSSDSSSDDFNSKTNADINEELMIERFIPRFQLLNTIQIPKLPELPKVVEKEPIMFNPHRDYTYIMLFSEFFHTTHVLRCYEWDETRYHFEFSNRLDKNLGLTNVRVDYLFEPRQTVSMKSRTSVRSYQRIFDAATTFAFRCEISESSNEDSDQTADQKSSLINFLEMCILEKLEEIFNRVSSSTLSYDAYEVDVSPCSQENLGQPTITIQEILPYPPLSWDIISRPYHAYISSQYAFETPPIENIAHERHVSLLDGIKETRNELRYVPYPTGDTLQANQATESKLNFKMKICGLEPLYFVYDFFNLPWTSFLIYPFSWAYNSDFINCAYDVN